MSALELVDDVQAKLSNLNAIYRRAPMVDPLDNPDLGPAGEHGRVQHGSNVGKLVGALGGAALGGLAGHAIGGGLASGAANLGASIGGVVPGYDPVMGEQVHDFFNNVGSAEGTLTGGVVGGMLGHHLGGRIGGGIARLHSTPAEQAVERIRRMDPASGLAHIRMTEQSGHVSPEILQAMKDAYNTRRSGIQAQLGAGVAIPPGHTPYQVQSNRPTPLPV